MGTFAVMYLLGYTIDNLSLLALTLSVGFVVDDAIVMLENIVRHMEMGKGALEAALDGSKEVSFTILSMTLSLAAVFLPVFFMPGVFGRLLHEFAVVIISAVLVSGPGFPHPHPDALPRYLRPEHGSSTAGCTASWKACSMAALHWYGVSLRWAMRHRVLVMVSGFLILVGTAWEFWVDSEGLPARGGSVADFGLDRSQPGHLFRRDEGASGGRESDPARPIRTWFSSSPASATRTAPA